MLDRVENFENRKAIRDYENYLLRRIFKILDSGPNSVSFYDEINNVDQLRDNLHITDKFLVQTKKPSSSEYSSGGLFLSPIYRPLFNKYRVLKQCIESSGSEEEFCQKIMDNQNIFLAKVSNKDLSFFEAITQWLDSLLCGNHSEQFVNRFQR